MTTPEKPPRYNGTIAGGIAIGIVLQIAATILVFWLIVGARQAPRWILAMVAMLPVTFTAIAAYVFYYIGQSRTALGLIIAGAPFALLSMTCATMVLS